MKILSLSEKLSPFVAPLGHYNEIVMRKPTFPWGNKIVNSEGNSK